MTALALVLSAAVLITAAALRFGGSSLLHTPRADALHDAAEGIRGAERVARLLDDSPLVLQPSIGAVHTTLLIAAAIPATWAVTTVTAGFTLVGAFVGLGVLIVMFGDMVPRSLGRSRPRRPAYRLWWLTAPAVGIGRRIADLLVFDDESDPGPQDENDTQESDEIELIESVLEFGEAIVREVMVPRSDMVTLSASDDTDHALDVILEHGRSRVPVIGDDLDDVIGILYARDLLTLFDGGGGPRKVTELMRPVYFVPETKRVSELLRELQRSKVHLSVVIDEFGSTAGLVTIEDLVEEIVGEIIDEYDEELPMVEERADGSFGVDARLSVSELQDTFAIELPDGDWDTVGGLVLGLAGRVPAEGEAFDIAGLSVRVESVQGRRVSRVVIERL